MRSKNSVINAISAIIMYSVAIFASFFTQKVFIKSLGNEYLGLNGLFNNILSMLTVVELGFGTAIIYNLYKPVADNDEKKIKALMNYYKKIYNIVVIIITILGFCVLPFLDKIVGKVSINQNIKYLFILSLIDIIVSYLFSYKRSILYANQKTYVINLVHIGYTILSNIAEIIFLLETKNYVIYLIIKIIFRILENVVVTIFTNNMYPYIKKKNNEKIDSDTKRDVKKQVKGLLFHKLGGSIVFGTDNIVISNVFGVVTVGFYSNYYIIINAINTLLGQVFTSLTASIGNLLLEENKQKNYKIYKNFLFANSWMYMFCASCLICLMESFISLWIGDEYILRYSVLVILIINFYMQGMRKTCSTFKEASGIFYEDRFVPVIEAILNIILSIFFSKIFGLEGVFLGTILSTLVVYLYTFPKYIYKRIFNRTYIQYLLEMLKYFVIAFISVVITVAVTKVINIGKSNFTELIKNLFVCIIIPNLIYLILFFKSDEIKYFKDIFKNFIEQLKGE